MTELYQLFFHYLNGLWKRRWIVLICAWAIAIPGWIVVASMPSVYQSTSRIYVDTSSVLQPLLRGIAVQNDLGTQVQLMKQTLLSRPNLLEVARKTDLDLAIKGEGQREAMTGRLQRNTVISSDRQNIFSISYTDSNPERAYKVVEALLALFVESNLGQSRQDLDTAENFIDRQIEEYEARLVEAENRLAQFKQDNMDLALGEGGYLARASAANKLKEQFEQALEVAQAQRNHLRDELKQIPELLPSDLLAAGPPDDTERRIVEIEALLRQLLSQYTEKHPDVVTARRQLSALLAKQKAAREAIEEVAAIEGEGITEKVAFGAPNPIYGQVKLRLIELETQIEDLSRRARAARAEAAALAAKAEEVPQVEAEFQRLNRDYGIVRARHDELLARRESARMSRSRDAIGQQVQYRLIDPPVVARTPIGPNRPLFLSAVLALAVITGVGVALGLVILDTSFSSVAELRQYTDLRVLGVVSDNSRRTVRPGADAVVLAAGAGSLIGALAILLFIERQYGLSTISASLGGNVIEDGINLLLNRLYHLADFLRAQVLS